MLLFCCTKNWPCAKNCLRYILSSLGGRGHTQITQAIFYGIATYWGLQNSVLPNWVLPNYTHLNNTQLDITRMYYIIPNWAIPNYTQLSNIQLG